MEEFRTPNTLKSGSASFIERTIGKLAEVLQQAAGAEAHAETPGLLQRLDPRVKLVGLCSWILVAVSVGPVGLTLAMLGLAAGLALCSGISLRLLATRVWLGVLVFTGMIALPAVFLTPGEPLASVPVLHWPVTRQGVHAALRLLTRAETAATLAFLLVRTTPWSQVLKALRVFHVPVVLVVILGMTHRYIFLLLQISRDFFEARRCRLVGELDTRARRRLAVASTGVLLEKSLQLSEEVFAAMQSRGFTGEVCVIDDFRMKIRDWFALTAFIGTALMLFWAGRH